MRKKLLKALEKEWTEEKEPKHLLTLKKEDDEISDDSEEVIVLKLDFVKKLTFSFLALQVHPIDL